MGTVTATIAERKTQESATSIKSTENDQTIFVITGTNEKFKAVPLKGIPEQKISKSFFANCYKFGIFFGEPNTGLDGKKIYWCDIYKAEVDTAIEIDRNKNVYQVRNYNDRKQLYSKEKKTFSEKDNIKGFLTQTMRDWLEVVCVGTQVGEVA